MEKLKNQSGSTMLVTISLIALFGILLVGFHTAILAMTSRLDSTYSQKQTYLYARSAVTALAEELVDLNHDYDQAWEDYIDATNDGDDGTQAQMPGNMPALLAAVEGLTAASPTLELENCTFGDALVDDYDLEMSIQRVMEQNDEGLPELAYELTATATIRGVQEISDTVSILLHTRKSEHDITTEGGGSGSGSGDETDGFCGLYTDKPVNFGWITTMFPGASGGAVVVTGSDVDYLLHYDLDYGSEKVHWMVDGDLVFHANKQVSVCNVIFYVKENCTIHVDQNMTFENCIFYVAGDMTLAQSDTWQTMNLKNCVVQCGGEFNNGILAVKYSDAGTDIFENANVAAQIAKIPGRPLPDWVNVAENSTAISYTGQNALDLVPMTAGNVYRLDTTFTHWYPYLEDGIIQNATEDAPITIIIGAGVQVGVTDNCGPNIRFLVEPGGDLMIRSTDFEGDIYGYPAAAVQLKKQSGINNLFKGTIIVPELIIEGPEDYIFGGGGGMATVPEVSTETIQYNRYTDYIYVRR